MPMKRGVNRQLRDQLRGPVAQEHLVPHQSAVQLLLVRRRR